MNELDLKGLKCPLPVLRTQRTLKTMPKGAQVTILTTDPMAQIDIPHFCSENGHILVESKQIDDDTYRFVIQNSCAS